MSIFRATSKVFSLTFISRITGFLRDMLMSRFLGTGIFSEIFIIASRIPNLFRNFFADGAMNSAFVPTFSSVMAKSGKAKALKFASQTFTWLLLVLLFFTAVAEIGMPYFLRVFVPGFLEDPEKFALLTEISRITFPYLLLISLVSLAGGILNSTGHYGISSSMQIVGNLVMIGGIFFLAPPKVSTYAHTLGYAFILSGIVQFISIFTSLIRRKLVVKVVRPQKSPEVKGMMSRLLPGIVGSGVYHLNIAIDSIFASFVPGAVSYLYYSDRLVLLPQGIIAVSITTVLLPILSKNLAKNDLKEARSNQNKALTYAFFATLPCMVGIMALGYYALSVFFERGAFTSSDTLATTKALSAYAFAIPAFMMSKIFTCMFHAKLDTKTPVKIAGLSVILNLVLNLVLMQNFSYVGIAIATTISSWIGAMLLAIILARRHVLKIERATWLNLLRFAIASVVMYFVAIWARGQFAERWVDFNLIRRVIWLAVAGLLSGVSYLLTLFVLNFKKPNK